MHDIRFIRETPEAFDAGLKRRGLAPLSQTLLEIDKRRARVESASELSPEASRQLLDNLKRKYGQDLIAEFTVKPELLGGMRIRVGSDVWDATVRNRLERLQQQL